MQSFPSPGDKVEVPWGPGTVVGRVLRVYGPRSRRHVLVAIQLSDSNEAVDADQIEESTVSFPAALIRRPAAA